MIDPLVHFDWASLYPKYDRLCNRFNPSVPFLEGLAPSPESDRGLYYLLVDRFSRELTSSNGLSVETYEAMLYWKLYSQPAAVANLCKPLKDRNSLREELSSSLTTLSTELRSSRDAISNRTTEYVKGMSRYNLWGMKASTALPVRTTFLHFVDPSSVPIFDKQVLLAVGLGEKRANERIEFLDLYLPHAKTLAMRYSNYFEAFQNETPVRLIDMALWVVRGGC